MNECERGWCGVVKTMIVVCGGTNELKKLIKCNFQSNKKIIKNKAMLLCAKENADWVINC